ncbi:MAG: PP2C family protein-serine/threonine phosphatase [Candidatus Sulfotelmatobacter sp.]
MCALFQPRVPDPPPSLEPATNQFPKIQGGDIAASTYGKRVAGDFYDSLRVGPERVLFGLLDVAGRRASNQAILSAAQNAFRTLGAELFSRPDFNEADAMTELCIRLNRDLMEAARGVCSCPAFIGCYNEQFGTLCYTNAGHTPALLGDSKGAVELNSTGLPLGLFSHATCEAPTVGLAKRAVLLVVSRGVVEGHSKTDKNEDFGLERVKQCLLAQTSQSAQAWCASILKAVGEFTSEPLIAEDMSVLAFVRDP